MTTHADNLALITQTINTQYDLARIEIFRPLEHLDRYQGIKARELGHECKPHYESAVVGSSPPPIDLIRDVVGVIAKTSGASTAEVVLCRNTATCACDSLASARKPIIRHSVRVSITWNGRTLTREYLLPEVKP